MFLSQPELRELTGYKFRRQQIEWLERNGWRQGKDWWQSRENGPIVALRPDRGVRLATPAEPDYSALGPPQTNKQAPTAKRLHQARAVSAALQGPA